MPVATGHTSMHHFSGETVWGCQKVGLPSWHSTPLPATPSRSRLFCKDRAHPPPGGAAYPKSGRSCLAKVMCITAHLHGTPKHRKSSPKGWVKKGLRLGQCLLGSVFWLFSIRRRAKQTQTAQTTHMRQRWRSRAPLTGSYTQEIYLKQAIRSPS